MKNLTTIEDAAAYLDRKPVPCVKRGDLYYIVDHHHTLAALNASGHDVKVTLVVIMDIPEDLGTLQMFWDFMERRGFTFMRNPDYTHCDFDVSQLPRHTTSHPSPRTNTHTEHDATFTPQSQLK
jgi:hypothetical protein